MDENLRKGGFFGWSDPLYICIALAVLIPTSLYLYSLSTTKPKITLPTTTKTASIDYKNEVATDIKQTFTSSKHGDIITNINLASNEVDMQKSYGLYVKAFVRMKEEYQKTQSKDYLIAMTDLRTYVRSYPQFRRSDFLIQQ